MPWKIIEEPVIEEKVIFVNKDTIQKLYYPKDRLPIPLAPINLVSEKVGKSMQKGISKIIVDARSV